MLSKHALRASQVALVVKNLPANAGDVRDVGSAPGSYRSPGGGHGNSLQYSCLENPMDRGGWWDTVHGVAKSQTRLSDSTSGPSSSGDEVFGEHSCCDLLPPPSLPLGFLGVQLTHLLRQMLTIKNPKKS